MARGGRTHRFNAPRIGRELASSRRLRPRRRHPTRLPGLSRGLCHLPFIGLRPSAISGSVGSELAQANQDPRRRYTSPTAPTTKARCSTARSAVRLRAEPVRQRPTGAANNGALPPDLSVIAKARPGGETISTRADRLRGAPAFRGGAGMYYNALPRSDRHAAAAQRRRRQLHRRHQADARQLCARRLCLLMWAAEPKLESATWSARGSDLPLRLRGDHVLAKRARWRR